MNWYKIARYVSATVNFDIDGSHQIAQPMTLGDITYNMLTFAGYELKVKVQHNSFEVDTSRSDYFGYTGYINFYLWPELGMDEKTAINVVKRYAEKNSHRFEIKIEGYNKSNMYKTDVLRIAVTKNETQNYQELPSMNLANGNAMALLTVLRDRGVAVDVQGLAGKIDINQLEQALSLLESNPHNLNDMTQEPSIQQNKGKATVYNGGRTLEQVQGYISGLKQMVDYIRNNNLPSQYITYG